MSSFSADQQGIAEVVFEAFDLDGQWGWVDSEGFGGGGEGWVWRCGGEAKEPLPSFVSGEGGAQDPGCRGGLSLGGLDVAGTAALLTPPSSTRGCRSTGGSGRP